MLEGVLRQAAGIAGGGIPHALGHQTMRNLMDYDRIEKCNGGEGYLKNRHGLVTISTFCYSVN